MVARRHLGGGITACHPLAAHRPGDLPHPQSLLAAKRGHALLALCRTPRDRLFGRNVPVALRRHDQRPEPDVMDRHGTRAQHRVRIPHLRRLPIRHIFGRWPGIHPADAEQPAAIRRRLRRGRPQLEFPRFMDHHDRDERHRRRLPHRFAARLLRQQPERRQQLRPHGRQPLRHGLARAALQRPVLVRRRGGGRPRHPRGLARRRELDPRLRRHRQARRLGGAGHRPLALARSD